MWGGGYRRLENEIGKVPAQARSYILPEKRIDGLASLFIQDDITVVRDRLVLSLGTKVQHNAYTGLETQPNVRLLWTPNARQTVWAAGSRAVRTPVRLEHDLNLPFEFPAPLPPGTLGVLLGNRQFRSESAVSWEAGWRWQSKSWLSVDVATYLSQHRHLEVFRISTPRLETAPAPRLIVPIPWDNGLTVRNQGVELATTWKLRRRWSLQANYTWFREMDKRQTIPGATIQLHVTASPKHALQMQSSLGITPRLTLNLNGYGYSGVPERPVPGYFRPDANLTYRLGEQTEISAGVQNLLDPRHREFIAEDYVHGAEIKRSVFVRLSWGS
jgi:iron complex outermembrane receptor protein